MDLKSLIKEINLHKSVSDSSLCPDCSNKLKIYSESWSLFAPVIKYCDNENCPVLKSTGKRYET